MIRHLLLLSLILCLPGQEVSWQMLPASLKESVTSVSLLPEASYRYHRQALHMENLNIHSDRYSYSIGNTVNCSVSISPRDIQSVPIEIRSIWQEFVIAHEIAHCSFPKVWKTFAAQLVVDAPFIQQFYDLMNESYADAYAFQFVQKYYSHQEVWPAFVSFVQTFRHGEVINGSHGNTYVLEAMVHNSHAPLMETALISAYNTFIENPAYTRQMRYTTLIQGLAVMHLHHKMNGPYSSTPQDINSLTVAYFKVNSHDQFPEDLITRDQEMQSWKVNKERLQTWKKEIEKEPWFHHLAEQFIQEKEEQWDAVSDFVYHMT